MARYVKWLEILKFATVSTKIKRFKDKLIHERRDIGI